MSSTLTCLALGAEFCVIVGAGCTIVVSKLGRTGVIPMNLICFVGNVSPGG